MISLNVSRGTLQHKLLKVSALKCSDIEVEKVSSEHPYICTISLKLEYKYESNLVTAATGNLVPFSLTQECGHPCLDKYQCLCLSPLLPAALYSVGFSKVCGEVL